MNKRNRQIFGISSKVKIGAVVGGVLLIGVIMLLFTNNDGESKLGALSGAAIQELPNLKGSDETKNDIEIIEDTTELLGEEKPYFEYEGACAGQIKQARDDVEDIQNYLESHKSELELTKNAKESLVTANQQEIDTLQARITEWRQKINDLQETLNTAKIPHEQKIISLEGKITEGEENLNVANTKLGEITASCEA